jgi:hypothetical protein
MVDFLNGANMVACAVASLFFVRFWRQTADPLFASFALAFGLFALHWAALAVTPREYEFRPLIYLLRLVAFALIIGAIVVKNRGKPSTGRR